MSADNWTTCPRCKYRVQSEKAEQWFAVQEAYGKVPIKEWLALKEQADQPIYLDDTFREDYEFGGAETGTIIASYSGHCSACGLELKFKDEHHLWEANDD